MSKAFSILFKRVIPLLLIAVAAGFAILHTQGDQLLSVQTGSMEPAISRGDLLVVEAVPVHDLKVGDVITFKSDQEAFAGSTITHRIIELPNEQNSRQFITQGDANPTPDEPVAQNRIVGRVNTDVPYVGYMLNVLSTPAGLLAVIYLPALLIIIDEIRRLAQHFESQKPWRDLGHERFRSSNLNVIGSMIIMGTVLGSATTLARVNDSILVGPNTISAVQGLSCENESNVDVAIDGEGNENIGVGVSTDQGTATGNTTNSENTGTNGATSGNSSNCNSVGIDLNVNN